MQSIVLSVQIDDDAQNGPGHLLKIFFLSKGVICIERRTITQFHIYSLSFAYLYASTYLKMYFLHDM